jgi:hypothetical protein
VNHAKSLRPDPGGKTPKSSDLGRPAIAEPENMQ